MFERVRPFEPRIQHSMWKDKVRSWPMTEGAIDAETVVLPNTIDDDGIVVSRMLAKPGHKIRAVSKFAADGSQGMNFQRTVGYPRVFRRIQRNNVDDMTCLL